MRMLLSLVMAGCVWGLIPPAGAHPAQAKDDAVEKGRRVWVHYRWSSGAPSFETRDFIIDSKDLTPGEVKRLRHLIEKVSFFEEKPVLRVPLPAPGPLGRSELTVEMDGRRHVVQWGPRSERKDLLPLVTWIVLHGAPKEWLQKPPSSGPVEVRPANQGAVKGGVRPDRIFVDIIGELEIPEAVIPEFVPDGPRVLVKVNGRTFWLDLSGIPDFAVKVAAMNGKKVAVTGWLKYRPTLRAFASKDGAVIEAPVIVVTSLEPVKDPAVAPVVRVEITGTLQYSELQKDPPIPLWEITVQDRTYRLEFVVRGLRPKAEKLLGQRVQVTGTLQGDTVRVTDISVAPVA